MTFDDLRFKTILSNTALTTTSSEHQFQNTAKYFYVIYTGIYNNTQNYGGTSNIFVPGILSKVFITPIYRDTAGRSKYLGTIYAMISYYNNGNHYIKAFAYNDWVGGTSPNEADAPAIAVLGV